jgi:vacuolar-type H+-ATPase subunit I/STV1
MEADKSSGLSDYFLKEENFAKLKKQFDSKSGPQRTQQDIDKYNKAVDETNTAMKDYNKTNNELNKARSSALDNWNKANKKYMDNYMPTQR